MSDSTPPPGWYPDGQGTQRFWDGQRWTDQTAAGPPAAPVPPPAGPAHPGQPPYAAPYAAAPGPTSARGKGPLVAVVAVVAVVLLGAGAAGAFFLLGDDDDAPTSSAESADTDETSPSDAESVTEPSEPAETETEVEVEPVEPVDTETLDGADLVPEGFAGPEVGTPAATVQQFYDLATLGNCQAFALFTPELSGATGIDTATCEEQGFAELMGTTLDGCQLELIREYTEGTAAEVEFEVTQCDDTVNNETGTFELTQTDDGWLIDNFV